MAWSRKTTDSVLSNIPQLTSQAVTKTLPNIKKAGVGVSENLPLIMGGSAGLLGLPLGIAPLMAPAGAGAGYVVRDALRGFYQRPKTQTKEEMKKYAGKNLLEGIKTVGGAAMIAELAQLATNPFLPKQPPLATNTSKMTGNDFEKAAGWQEKGMKEKFDMALLNKDKKTVGKLLPDIPQYYKEKMIGTIQKVLSDIPLREQAKLDTIERMRDTFEGVLKRNPESHVGQFFSPGGWINKY